MAIRRQASTLRRMMNTNGGDDKPENTSKKIKVRVVGKDGKIGTVEKTKEEINNDPQMNEQKEKSIQRKDNEHAANRVLSDKGVVGNAVENKANRDGLINEAKKNPQGKIGIEFSKKGGY